MIRRAQTMNSRGNSIGPWRRAFVKTASCSNSASSSTVLAALGPAAGAICLQRARGAVAIAAGAAVPKNRISRKVAKGGPPSRNLGSEGVRRRRSTLAFGFKVWSLPISRSELAPGWLAQNRARRTRSLVRSRDRPRQSSVEDRHAVRVVPASEASRQGHDRVFAPASHLRPDVRAGHTQ